MRIGMFEPKQSAIDDTVQEMLAEALLDDDMLIDALISCLDEFRAWYKDRDARFELKEAIDKHVINYMGLEALAINALIEECGYTVRTDVDDYKFIPHDTRY
jgi:hypothetical protein